MKKTGIAIIAIGTAYLVVVAWLSSWWMVPALAARTQTTDTAMAILWASAGVLGAVVIAIGAAVYGGAGRWRLLILATGSALLVAWLFFWVPAGYNGTVFGAGGGLILLFFLVACIEWAGARRRLEGAAQTAADLRLGANLSFFIAAWGLCGLLGAPVFLLRPEVHGMQTGGTNLAVKVLACLVLGWGLTALAQRLERRALTAPARQGP